MERCEVGVFPCLARAEAEKSTIAAEWTRFIVFFGQNQRVFICPASVALLLLVGRCGDGSRGHRSCGRK